MLLHEWMSKYKISGHTRFSVNGWPKDLEMKLIWDTCLDPKLLLEIIKCSDLKEASVRPSSDASTILQDMEASTYKLHIIGLEYILMSKSTFPTEVAVSILKCATSSMDNLRACVFIRSRVGFPL